MREGPAKGELDAEGVLKWRPQTDCGPGYAVDGDTNTAWAWDSQNEGTAWLEIDFGKAESFNFVELANVHRCSKVDIAVKREEKWETIHTFDIDQWKTLTYSTRVPLYHSWTASVHRVQQLDPVERTARFTNPSGSVDAKQRYHVENYREAFDQPGEWYLERETDTLYY